MSRRSRLGLFAVAAVVLAVVLVHGLAGLPPFGDYHGVYEIEDEATTPGQIFSSLLEELKKTCARRIASRRSARV